MHAHEQRVVDEKCDLDDKLAKLTQFISASPVFARLHPFDQALLEQQRAAMMIYSEALANRIARFAP